MKNNIIHLNSAFINKSIDEDSSIATISGYANTVSKDRAHDVIVPEAWKTVNALTNFRKNPILLYQHQHDKPIGKCVELNPDMQGLSIVGEVHKKANEQAYYCVDNGILKSFSVGFRCLDADWDSTTDTFLITDLELLEISVVSVPCNQDSLFDVSKSFSSREEFREFKRSISKGSNEAPSQNELINNYIYSLLGRKK